jgi:hypothetical protein
MTDRHDYLPRVRRLAGELVGRRLVRVLRLLDIELEEDADLRREWGPALLETDDGRRLRADVDEAKANLLLSELPADDRELDARLGRLRVRPPIVTDDPNDPLRALVTQPIEHVEEISREPDPTWEGAWELCGLRLTLAGGSQVLLGTDLTDVNLPGAWFLLPDEADPALRYAPLAVPPHGVRYEYATGLENAPSDPFGRTELAIEPDGAARLDHRHVGRHRAWTARVDPQVLERLQATLERAGFPNVASHPVPAGAAIRTLVAERHGVREGVHVAWHAAKDLPGYDEAFAILDSLVRQMSEDTVKAAPDTLPPAVVDLRRVAG